MDEQVRAGLKGQTPVVVEFPIGKEGITLDFAEQVEKGLTVLGKHTYLYHPAASENYAETVRHLKAAGLIVLLVLDENTAKDETLKTLDGFYANWQIDGITVKDAIDFVKRNLHLQCRVYMMEIISDYNRAINRRRDKESLCGILFS